MPDERAIKCAFAAAASAASVDTFTVSSTEVEAGARRFEALFYGSDGYRARKRLESSGFTLEPVSAVADVVWFGPFRRHFVSNSKNGLAFYSSSTMMLAKPAPEAFVSRLLTKNLEKLQVVSGTILISCSGTIGNTVIVSEGVAGAALTQDAIRVVPHSDDAAAVLYAFFQSTAGQFLLTRSKSGGVVEHLYEADVSRLLAPRLPRQLRLEMNRLMDCCCNGRTEANRLLAEAESDIQRVCYLPDLDKIPLEGVLANEDGVDAFIQSASARLANSDRFGQVRLDATFHDPRALALEQHILKQIGGTTLGTLVEDIRNSSLRKRVYVDDPALGTPLLGGKQMMQIRPRGLNYLSNALTRNLSKELLHHGWTLVSCGGTLGRCMYLHRNYEKFAASQHVMRVIPNESRVFSGFLYAFLASSYGQIQIQRRAYGSVIPELRDFQLGSVAIRVPKDRGESVHDKVVAAFDARADAMKAEDELIGLFDTAMERGRDYIEREWGSEY